MLAVLDDGALETVFDLCGMVMVSNEWYRISSNDCEVTGNCSTTTGDVVREGTLPTVGDPVDATSLGVSLMVGSFDAAEDCEPCRSLLIRALKPVFVTLEDFVPNTDGTS